MECIVFNKSVFLIGKTKEITVFLNNKSKTCKTIRDVIISESQLKQKKINT